MNGIRLLQALYDNYIALVKSGNGAALVIDPSEAEQVLSFCRKEHLRVTAVLITHHHADHTGGVAELRKKTGCALYGPDDSRIANSDSVVGDDSTVAINLLTIRALAVPGHTKTHMAYYIPELKALFTGDTLFAAGCGRLFEGSAGQMHASLQKLMQFPDDTLVYCGHEYTLENLQFASSVVPQDRAVEERLGTVRKMRSLGEPTIPSTIALEKATNLFLRTNDPSIRKALGMERAGDTEVFAELRRRKDLF